MEERISSELKLTELKRESFRQSLEQLHERASSIISFTHQLKDIEDHFTSIQNAIEERAKELQLLQHSVEQKSEEAQQNEYKWNVVKKSAKEKLREIEAREKELELIRKNGIEERERDIEWIEKSRRELGAVSESIDRKLRLLEEKERRIELLNASIDDKAIHIREKEREVNKAFKEMEAKEKKVEEQSKLVTLKDDNFTRLLLEVQENAKNLEEERKELGLKAKKFRDLEFKEKRIQERREEMELEQKKFMERCKEVELKEKQLNERCREFELKEKQLSERCREFELKERHFVDGRQNPLVGNYANDNSADANLHFAVTMDGKALQIFLNEHCEEHDSMRDDVFKALGLSSDPAKLVLDAMEGFYPPHLEKGKKKFEEVVVRRSCILLLEQLMKISVEIKPHVKKEARRLAFDWSEKMKVDAAHALEVLGFLQLLASYGLASAFNADELLTKLEIVAQHSQAPKLFRILGLTDKISGFIENLIGKKQYIEAIRFICAFELVNDFPPVALLNNYLKDSKNFARRLRKRTKSPEGEIEAANRRIADLRCALKCSEDYNIEFGPNLKQLVDCFEKENSKRNANLAGIGHLDKEKNMASTVAAMDAPVTASAISTSLSCFPKALSTFVPVTNTQSEQSSGIEQCVNQATSTIPIRVKIEQSSLGDLPSESKEASGSLVPQPETNFSVNARKEDLRQLLNILENRQLQHGEIAAALQSACDPGKLVLDVMNVSFPSGRKKDFKSDIPMKSCIFLLEQLRKLPPKADIKEQAKEFALNWKLVLIRNRMGPLEVICFMQFLAAYSLASVFEPNELLGLLDTNDWCKEAPDLCQVLGLADKIPSFIEDCIKKSQHLEAVKYIFAWNIVDKYPPAPILKDYLSLSNSSKRSNSIGVNIEDIRKEINSLEYVKKCISDYKIIGFSLKKLKKRIVQLEKQTKELDKKIEASEVRERSLRSFDSKLDQEVSPASAATTSASTTCAQPQQQSGKKRRRIHMSSEDPSKAFIGAKPAVHSTQFPLPRASGLCMRQGVPCMNMPPREYSLEAYPPPTDYSFAAYPPPPRDYSFTAYPPYNMGLNRYRPSVIPPYHRSAFGNPGHDRQMF